MTKVIEVKGLGDICLIPKYEMLHKALELAKEKEVTLSIVFYDDEMVDISCESPALGESFTQKTHSFEIAFELCIENLSR